MQNIGDINKCHRPLFAHSQAGSNDECVGEWIERNGNGHNDISMEILRDPVKLKR